MHQSYLYIGGMMFHYSTYWRTWSRVLKVEGDCNTYTEVNLTPVNPQLSRRWEEQVRPIIIRVHRTTPQQGEMHLHLPDTVREMMTHMLGYGLTRRLLTDDLLAEIDPELIKVYMQGDGVPLDKIRKVG